MDWKMAGITLREVTGIFLLVAILLTGLFASWYLGRQQTQMADLLEESAWMALSGQWSNARETAAAAREEWQKKWKLRAALTDHEPLEDIDTLFEELTIYGAAGEEAEFAKSCAAIAQKMDTLAGAYRLSWWNVL